MYCDGVYIIDLAAPNFRDDFGLLFGGKNAGRIPKLLVREIELSEHVETAPRLR